MHILKAARLTRLGHVARMPHGSMGWWAWVCVSCYNSGQSCLCQPNGSDTGRPLIPHLDEGQVQKGKEGLGGVVGRPCSTWRDRAFAALELRSAPGSRVPVGGVGLLWGGSGLCAVACPL
eukprot:44754-Chlamydomonas_euryale.AAC.3